MINRAQMEQWIRRQQHARARALFVALLRSGHQPGRK